MGPAFRPGVHLAKPARPRSIGEPPSSPVPPTPVPQFPEFPQFPGFPDSPSSPSSHESPVSPVPQFPVSYCCRSIVTGSILVARLAGR